MSSLRTRKATFCVYTEMLQDVIRRLGPGILEQSGAHLEGAAGPDVEERKIGRGSGQKNVIMECNGGARAKVDVAGPLAPRGLIENGSEGTGII